ncbi:hypothetical protein NMG60_11025769 [Bertholletia excelsa]
MGSWEKSLREDRYRRNPPNPPLTSNIPSFSSSLLDEIYRSIDNGSDTKCGEMKFCKEKFSRKQSNGGGHRAKISSTVDDEETASLRQACLIEKCMENKVSARQRQSRQELKKHCRPYDNINDHPVFFSSSSTSSDSSSGGFSSSDTVFLRPKPVRTSVWGPSEKLGKASSYYEQSEYYVFEDYDNRRRENPGEPKPDYGLIKSKMRALNIYNNLKKVKQPISPGGKLASLLNSLFTHTGNSKKTKSSCSSIGGYEEASMERKAVSTQTSTCSSASSYYRSCLSKNPLNSKEKSKSGERRTVRFSPVGVIVGEDCRPCGQKSIYEGNSDKFNGSRTRGELDAILEDKTRKIEEAARNILKGYTKNEVIFRKGSTEYEDEDCDAASDASSDLFELDHLEFIGNENRYSEELPVYETTHLGMNRAIANGLIR